MTTQLLLQFIYVYVVVFAADVCWAFYVTGVKDGSPVRSANWATVLFVLSGLATISFVSNWWLLIPAGLGAWSGTWVAVQMNKRFNKVVEEIFEEGFGSKPIS